MRSVAMANPSSSATEARKPGPRSAPHARRSPSVSAAFDELVEADRDDERGARVVRGAAGRRGLGAHEVGVAGLSDETRALEETADLRPLGRDLGDDARRSEDRRLVDERRQKMPPVPLPLPSRLDGEPMDVVCLAIPLGRDQDADRLVPLERNHAARRPEPDLTNAALEILDGDRRIGPEVRHPTRVMRRDEQGNVVGPTETISGHDPLRTASGAVRQPAAGRAGPRCAQCSVGFWRRFASIAAMMPTSFSGSVPADVDAGSTRWLRAGSARSITSRAGAGFA